MLELLNIASLAFKALSAFLGLERLFSSFKAAKVNAAQQKAAADAPKTPQEVLSTLDEGKL